MRVTKAMVNEGLRSSFNVLKITPYLLSKKWGINLLNFLLKFSKGKKLKRLDNEEQYIPSNDGSVSIRVRIFRPPHVKSKLPAVFYFHGGGFAIGNPEMSLSIIEKFIQTRPCCVICPDYRKSLSAPFPAGFNDCYDTILWVKENANSLKIHDSKFIVAGHSAGGGLAAAVTLKARDTKDFDIAFQMPMYPMLDDRLNTKSAMDMVVPALDSNALSKVWNFYMREINDRNEAVPIYAAPGRSNNYKNYPPTISFIGEFDPLKDETMAYIEALEKEGVQVMFKFYKGCFHGFEDVVSNTDISKDAIDFTLQSFAIYYDKFILDISHELNRRMNVTNNF